MQQVNRCFYNEIKTENMLLSMKTPNNIISQLPETLRHGWFIVILSPRIPYCNHLNQGVQ